MAYPGDDEDDYETLEGDAAWEEEEQLALADEDETLPWLESDDYDEEPGFDWRLIWMALIGLVLVGAFLFALWWFTRDASDPELLPEGSTIAAPDGAYKERPEDPGGSEVEGTGDQAFEVAEGQSTRGIISQDEAPRPSINPDQQPGAGPAESGSAAFVQIGAYGSRADADAAWAAATGRYTVLSGMRHRVVEGEVNGATVYRLQAVSGDRDSAEATCRAIRGAGGDCYVR